MKRVMAVFLFLVLCSAAQAVVLSDYPYFFVNQGKFDAIYVVGEEAPALDVVSATIISTALARYANVTTEVGTSRVDSEIPNIVYRNAIVIGNPCENKAAAILEGNKTPCYANLSGGIGYIKLFEQNGKVQLLITGLDEEDRHAAAKFLATASLQNVLAREFQVASGSGSNSATYTPSLSNRIINQITNQSIVATNTSNNETIKNVTKPKPKKEKISEYEPIDRMPERKGFFSRFWAWIMSLFR